MTKAQHNPITQRAEAVGADIRKLIDKRDGDTVTITLTERRSP